MKFFDFCRNQNFRVRQGSLRSEQKEGSYILQSHSRLLEKNDSTQNSKYLDQCQKIVIGKILLHNDRLHNLCLIVKHLNGEWKQRLSILSQKIEKIQLAFRFFLLPSRQTQSSRIWNNRNGQHSSWPHLIDDPPIDYWYKTNILLICRILCSSSISTMSFTFLNANAYIDDVAVNLWWTQS